MPVNGRKVTEGISRLIVEAKKAGKSNAEAIRIVKEQTGIVLDPSTVSRHLLAIAGKPRVRKNPGGRPGPAPRPFVPPPLPQAVPSAPSPKAGKGKAAKTGPRSPAPNPNPGGDEEASLRLQISRLETILSSDLPFSDRTRVNKELRLTYAQLRKLQEVNAGSGTSKSSTRAAADAEAVLERLRKMTAARARDTSPQAVEADSDEEETGAGSEPRRAAS